MRYNFYLQGLPTLRDGKLLMSLDTHEYNAASRHESFQNSLLEKMIRSAPRDNSIQTISPVELASYIPILETEVESLKKTFPNTPSNPMLQDGFYLRQAISILHWASKKGVEESRAIIVNGTNHDTKSFASDRAFSRTYDHVWERACTIDKVTVTYGDNQHIYEGTVEWRDLFEGSFGDDRWVSHPVPSEAVADDLIGTRPTDIHCMTNGYDFTLLSSFNAFLKQHILETIRRLEKNEISP